MQLGEETDEATSYNRWVCNPRYGYTALHNWQSRLEQTCGCPIRQYVHHWTVSRLSFYSLSSTDSNGSGRPGSRRITHLAGQKGRRKVSVLYERTIRHTVCQEGSLTNAYPKELAASSLACGTRCNCRMGLVGSHVSVCLKILGSIVGCGFANRLFIALIGPHH